MKTYQIDGVILRTNDFADSNRVVTIFTKERGKLELNAYGCRRSRNPMSGALQMFNHISAEVSGSGKVDTIREADVIKFCSGLTADVERMAYASIFFEVVNRMTLPKFPEAGVYELLVKSLPALDSRDARIAALIGICQFLEFSGVQLRYFECVNCGVVLEGDAGISLTDGGAFCHECFDDAAGDLEFYSQENRLAFAEMLAFDWRTETRLKFSQRQIDWTEKILWRYVRYVLGQELNAVKFVRSLQ